MRVRPGLGSRLIQGIGLETVPEGSNVLNIRYLSSVQKYCNCRSFFAVSSSTAVLSRLNYWILLVRPSSLPPLLHSRRSPQSMFNLLMVVELQLLL